MSFIKTTTVRINGNDYEVAGGDFNERKTVIKSIPGAKWLGFEAVPEKVWNLPLSTFEEVKVEVEKNGLELLGNDDQLLDRELTYIVQLQKELLFQKEAAIFIGDRQQQKGRGYSFKSKSRIKAKALLESGCLQHAVNHASKPVEQLTEPEIASIKAAIKTLDSYSAISLREWLFHFQQETPLSWSTQVPLYWVNLSEVPQEENQYLLDQYRLDVAAAESVEWHTLPEIEITQAMDNTLTMVEVMQFSF